jgi:coenzyme PQQ synthesis protein D (PqqD)
MPLPSKCPRRAETHYKVYLIIAALDRVRSHPGVIASECNDELVLLNIERGRCYGMNRIGTRIWQELSEPVVVSNLINQLQLEYRDNSASSEREILDFLQDLADEGLIENISAVRSGGEQI